MRDGLLDIMQVADLLNLAPRAVRTALDEADHSRVPLPIYLSRRTKQPRWCASQFRPAGKAPKPAPVDEKPKRKPRADAGRPRRAQVITPAAPGELPRPWEVAA